MPILSKFLGLALILLSFKAFADSDGKKDALVIIDMQPYFIERSLYHSEAENTRKVQEVLKNQKEAIKAAKAANIPIIFIKYKSYGDVASELKQEVKDYKEVKYFLKDTDGMLEKYNFKRKDLISYLSSKDIGNLIILGSNGGSCVASSIYGALEENYSVMAYLNGIADFNFPDFEYPQKNYRIKPDCRDCKFRETNDLNVIIMEMASTKKEKSDVAIDDTSRTPKLKKAEASENGDDKKTVNGLVK